MAYIGPEPNPGQNREVDDISSSFNGSTTAFTLQVNSQNVSPGSSNAIIVSVGGVVQNPGTDYVVAASTITFTTAPASGLSFFGLVLGQQVDIQSVADSASIVSPTLSGPTVTGDLSIADKIIHTGDTNTAIRFPAADTITAETGGSERVRVGSSGVVEVNSPSLSTDAKLIVKGNDTNNHDIITAYANSSTRGSFAIRTGSGISPSFLIGTRGGSETFAFMTNGTERVRVTDNGLTFNGDTAAANALDDYEEGTWTPTAHGYTGSNTANNCFYTKIGRLVIATFRITWPSLTNSSSAEIRGLPFTARAQAVNTHGGAFSETNDNDNLHLIVQQNTTTMFILRCTSSGVDTQTISEVSGKDFRGNVIYFTDS